MLPRALPVTVGGMTETSAPPVTDDDLWQIPAKHRDTIARWLIQHGASFQPSTFLPADLAVIIASAFDGAAVDLAEPGAEDSTLDHAQAVLDRLSGPEAGK